MKNSLFKITAAGEKPAVYGVTINEGGIVISTSQDTRYMLGWNIDDVKQHCDRVKMKLEKIHNDR